MKLASGTNISSDKAGLKPAFFAISQLQRMLNAMIPRMTIA